MSGEKGRKQIKNEGVEKIWDEQEKENRREAERRLKILIKDRFKKAE